MAHNMSQCRVLVVALSRTTPTNEQLYILTSAPWVHVKAGTQASIDEVVQTQLGLASL